MHAALKSKSEKVDFLSHVCVCVCVLCALLLPVDAMCKAQARALAAPHDASAACCMTADGILLSNMHVLTPLKHVQRI
jgi:hypothetical protein